MMIVFKGGYMKLFLAILTGLIILIGGTLIGYCNRPDTKVPQDITLRVNGKIFHLYWELTKVTTDDPWKD